MSKNQVVVEVNFNKEVVRAKYVDYGNGRYSVRIKGQPVVKIRWAKEITVYGERQLSRAGYEASAKIGSQEMTTITPRFSTPQRALAQVLKSFINSGVAPTGPLLSHHKSQNEMIRYESAKTERGNIGVSYSSQEDAYAQAREMDERNCSGCTNCTNCAYCSGCTNCSYCISCSDCTHCSDCSGCYGYSDCSGFYG